MNWTSRPTAFKQLKGMRNKETLGFEHPIQRRGDQWTQWQQTMLVHSLLSNYPVPPIFIVKDENEVSQVIDGKQRITSLLAFEADEYPLHKDMPPTYLDDEDRTVELGGLRFSELDEEIQFAFYTKTLTFTKVENATPSEIEEMFSRLNSGTPLSKQQKAKADMGSEWASIFQEATDHPFMQECAHFTPTQIKNSDDEVAIIQTMMLMDKEYDFKGFNKTQVAEYTESFKENKEYREELFHSIIRGFDYLHDSLGEKEKYLLKKVHFPMMVMTAITARENQLSNEIFTDWMEQFKDELKDKSAPMKYRDFTGQGTVKKDMAVGRAIEMEIHLLKYVKEHTNFETSLVYALEDKYPI